MRPSINRCKVRAGEAMIPGSQKCLHCTGRRHRASPRSFKTIRAVRPLDGGRKRGPGTHGKQWLVGSNYIPQNATKSIGDVASADLLTQPKSIRNWGWAEDLGMNTMRGVLARPGLAGDPSKFKQRIEQFLKISSAHHVKPLFVLFDSCWDPHPKLGPQHPPVSRCS